MLIINKNFIERKKIIKFLRVLLEQNLNWKECIKHTENKIIKNVGLLYKAPPLDKNTLLALNYLFLHTNIN